MFFFFSFVGLQIRNWIICRPRFLCLNWKKKKLIGTIDATKRPEQLAVGPFFHPSPNVFEYNQTLTFSYQIKTESSRNCVLRHDVSGARFFFFFRFRVWLVFVCILFFKFYWLVSGFSFVIGMSKTLEIGSTTHVCVLFL